MIRLDPFDLYSVVTGTIRLDGGAMFGVVPKVMWEKKSDVDDLNRVLLATRTLMAVNSQAGRVVLVDTGCGSKWDPKQADRYGIAVRPGAIADALASIGLSESDVTDVVVTHLHFDHNGGLTDWADEPNGATVLRYPKAKHWIHRNHWDHANNPHIKDAASFLPHDFEALTTSGALSFVNGEEPASPLEGMGVVVSHGHTPFQLHPIFGAGTERLLFAGDIVPTVAHLRLAWVMAYDVEPVVTIREKERFYGRCFDEGIVVAFPHDPELGGVAIDGTAARPIVARTLDLSTPTAPA